jgi:hypothetical protein
MQNRSGRVSNADLPGPVAASTAPLSPPGDFSVHCHCISKQSQPSIRCRVGVSTLIFIVSTTAMVTLIAIGVEATVAAATLASVGFAATKLADRLMADPSPK